MPLYRYRAKNMSGKVSTGILDAASEMAVVYRLREKGRYPTSIEEKKKQTVRLSVGKLFERITQKDLAVFCRQFATALNAGIPILTGLDILRKQNGSPKMRAAVENLYREVQKGKSLSFIMRMHRKVFPQMLVNMIEAGELSGTLDKVMERMASHYEKEYRISQKVKNALVYPSLVAVVAIIVVVILVTVVLPTFVSMFEDTEMVLPLSTRILISISGILRGNILVLLIAAGGLHVLFRVCTKSGAGKRLLDTIRLKVPIMGSVNKKMAAARFARTLGAMVSSGISLLRGIEITMKVVDNTIIRDKLGSVEDHVKTGRGLFQPLKDADIFPPMLIQMVKIGEDTGTLDYMLAKTADVFDSEVENAVTRMTTLLEPAIIVAMAFVVGFIVISLVMPMFDMMTSVNF